MSFPYFITAIDTTCDYVGTTPYYALEDLPQNVTGFYYDEYLVYKLYTGQPQTIGWSSEYAGYSMYYGNMDSLGEITNVTSCTGPTTTTTTTLPPSTEFDRWYAVLQSVLGFEVCGNILMTELYTPTGYTSAPLTITAFYDNTGLTSKYSPGADTIGYSAYPEMHATYYANINSSGDLSGNTACPAPTTTTTTTAGPYISPIGFILEPNSTDLYYARSPIVYRYSGLTISPDISYSFYLYVGSGDTVNTGTTIYTKIDRKTDTLSGITIDVSNMLRTYIKNFFLYDSTNICYFTGTLLEYSGTTLRTTRNSNWSKAVLGYTNYSGTGTFNKTTTGDYLMNTITPNLPYYVPDYSTSADRYDLYWRYTGTQSTGYVSTTETVIFNSGTSSIVKIPVVMGTNFTITFYNCSSAITSYTFYPDTCNGNDLTTVSFLNKFGMWDKFYFRGRKDTQLDVTNETYKFNNVNYSNMTYNTREGSYHNYNSQGREKLVLNTGWINEDKNEQIKEMLLSEYIQIDSLPYIITDKELKYKTNKWDKLINYSITFQKSYDEINNII